MPGSPTPKVGSTMVCSSCKLPHNVYMVNDEIWAQVGMTPQDINNPRALPGEFLCITCLQIKLGRPLGPTDFKPVLANWWVPLYLNLNRAPAFIAIGLQLLSREHGHIHVTFSTPETNGYQLTLNDPRPEFRRKTKWKKKAKSAGEGK